MKADEAYLRAYKHDIQPDLFCLFVRGNPDEPGMPQPSCGMERKHMSPPVVLVTGALTGIGRAIAVAFAKKGAKVVASGRHDDAGAEGKPGRAVSRPRRVMPRLSTPMSSARSSA
jgi:hypothetical protein